MRGDRTETCSDHTAIARNVTARLGRDVFAESAQESIEGVIQHEGGRWEARLYVRDANGLLVGSRSLVSESPDCAALDAAVTLAIALTIDPDAALRSPPRAPPAPSSAAASVSLPRAPVPESSAAAAPAPSPPPPCPAPAPQPVAPPLQCPARPAEPVSPVPPAHGGALSSAAVAMRGVVAAQGLLPAPAPGVAIATEASTGGLLSATAGVLFLPEVRTSGQDFAFGLTAAWLGLCEQPWRNQVSSLAVCGKVQLGALHAVVFHTAVNTLTPDNPGDSVWASASLSLAVRLRLVGPLFGELGGEGLVPFSRNKFMIKDQPVPTFQEQWVAGFGFVGLGVSIP